MKKIAALILCFLAGVSALRYLPVGTERKITRLLRARVPAWSNACPPMLPNNYQAVCYIDERDPNVVVYYYDRDGVGILHKVTAYERSGLGWRGRSLMEYWILEDEARAHELTHRNLERRSFGGITFFSRGSQEAVQLQKMYEEVRGEYHRLHPAEALRENVENDDANRTR